MASKKQPLTDKEIALELTKLSNKLGVAMISNRGGFEEEYVFSIVKKDYLDFLNLVKEDK